VSPRPARQKKLDATALWEYALKLTAARAMSAGDIRSRLRRRAEKEEDVETVLDKLREYGAVNDRKYAEAYAAARKDNQGFGRLRVLRDLGQHRVSRRTAETAVAQVFAGSDEVAMIQQFLERKYRGRSLPEILAEPKGMAAAYRRLRLAGFSTGNCVRVLKRYSEQADQLESLENEPEGDY